jgi:hypothetical protein
MIEAQERYLERSQRIARGNHARIVRLHACSV